VLIAAAICPHPPLLVPDAACGAAAELDEMRAACDAAVAVLAQEHPDLIVAVGAAATTAEFDCDAAGSLAAYGVGWRTGAGPPVLPLSLTIGRWLLQRAGLVGQRAGLVGQRAGLVGQRAGLVGQRAGLVGAGPGEENARSGAAADAGRACVAPCVRLNATQFRTPPAHCLRRGAEIAGRAGRVALLAMGDGPACLSPQAPGYFDARAQQYDADVAAALAAADAGRLARLDPDVSADLLVAGRAAWQVLAGAAGDGRYRGQLHRAAAPYGVSYLVASWTRLI
jgi:hypothetical protein